MYNDMIARGIGKANSTKIEELEGYIGSTGIQGYTGSQGVVGYIGSQGDLGYTGSTGAGYTGSQGITGYTGSTSIAEVTPSSVNNLTNKTLTLPKINEDTVLTSTATDIDGTVSDRLELTNLSILTDWDSILNITPGPTNTVVDGINFRYTDTNITVPNYIKGSPVVIDAINAFSYNTTITYVNMGTKVGFYGNTMESAFDGCTNLLKIDYIPNSVTNMNYTFRDCPNLSMSVIIPSSVLTLDSTFLNCTNLSGTMAIEGNKLTNGSMPNMFNGTTIAKTICVEPVGFNATANTYNCALNGINGINGVTVVPYNNIFTYSTDTSNTTISAWIGSTTTTDVVIPSVLNTFPTLVNSDVFSYNTDITKISFGQDVNFATSNSIEDMFYSCSSLSDIGSLPPNITSIHGAFGRCPSLVNIPVFPNKIIDMADSFLNCTSLSNVPNIPNSVVNLHGTFRGCSNIVNAPIIGYAVLDMSETFQNCVNLVNAPIIPNGALDLNSLFEECISLTNAPLIPNSVIDCPYTFYNCTNLVNAPIIPDSVTNLFHCFENCTSLVNVPKISNNITQLGFGFAYCENLVNAPIISNKVINMVQTFDSCTNLVNIPPIPNSVEDLFSTFQWCTSLVTAPHIGTGVLDMGYTFQGCTNLVGDIIVSSPNITSFEECFLDCDPAKAKTLKCPAGSDTYTLAMSTCNGLYGVTVVGI